MNRPLRSLCLLLAAGTAFAASTARPAVARADDANAAGASPSARAGELYRRATRLYADKKLADAEPLYRQAWELQQSYEIASNFGALELELGNPKQAVELLARAVSEFPVRGRAEERAALEARLAEARKLVGTLRIKVTLPGAEVVVDGRPVGRSPLPASILVEPGTRLIEARLAGYVDTHFSLRVDKGQSFDVSLALLPPRRRSAALLFAGGAVGLAALGVGAALIGLAEKQRSDAEALHGSIAAGGGSCAAPAPGCANLHATTARADTFGNTGLALMGVAGAAAAFTVTYLIWPAASSGRARAPDVRASLGIGTATLTGSF